MGANFMSIRLKSQTITYPKQTQRIKIPNTMPELQTEYSSILALNAC